MLFVPDDRLSIAMKNKSSNGIQVSHWHCIVCKQINNNGTRKKGVIIYAMINGLRTKNILYIPNMSCDLLCQWKPEER